MISPGMGAAAAERVAEVYRDAELRILARISRSLQEGIDAPEWETLQLARLQAIRAEVLDELQSINPVAARAIVDELGAAYATGSLSALADVGSKLDPLNGSTRARRAAVAALAADATRGITSAQPAILRAVDDVYRRVVESATASVLAGGEGRRAATQRVLTQLMSAGLRSIDTKRGQMDLPTYVTMAVRTATARAAIQGHTDQMDELGLDLVIISPGPRTCDICDEWARLILARKGRPGIYELPNELGGKPVEVIVNGTLDRARAGGWGHPNCRCGISVYLPGVTDPSTIQRPPWDKAAYEAQQQQRGIERQIRSWKQREAVAVTPDAKREAADRVKAWQGAMRDHLDQNPQLKRQGKRELIGGTQTGNPTQARKPRGLKTAEPTVSNPKLQRLARLPEPESMVTATKGLTVNPGFGVNRDYGVNCSYVVNAVELRARGFDVIATPLAASFKGNGRNMTEISSEWRNADGSTPSFIPAKGGKAGLERSMEDWPEGARGYVVISWTGGGSHIFNAERRDGKIQYHEGQVAESDASAYFKRRKTGSFLWSMRVDNLTPTDDLVDNGVVVAADSARGREIREAAALKANAATQLQSYADELTALILRRGEAADAGNRILVEVLNAKIKTMRENRPT